MGFENGMKGRWGGVFARRTNVNNGTPVSSWERGW